MNIAANRPVANGAQGFARAADVEHLLAGVEQIDLADEGAEAGLEEKLGAEAGAATDVQRGHFGGHRRILAEVIAGEPLELFGQGFPQALARLRRKGGAGREERDLDGAMKGARRQA